MPDIFAVLVKRWKLIAAFTLGATLLAFTVSVLRPKEYLATVTALPANSTAADKARIFNTNIEALYPELGSPDELDRIEGTSKLDTLYLALASSYSLATHYGIKPSPTAPYTAGLALKKKTDIRRTAYGELKIKVWDTDPLLSAQLANALLDALNNLHGALQRANSAAMLAGIKQKAAAKQKELDSIETLLTTYKGGTTLINPAGTSSQSDSAGTSLKSANNVSRMATRITGLQQQLKEYERILTQYELADAYNPYVLLPIERARPAIGPDKPNTAQNTLAAFGASLVFSFLLALYIESRNRHQ